MPDNQQSHSSFSDFDIHCMQRALDYARQAQENAEVPVGAVIASSGEIIAGAGNQPIGLSDPTGHAEILALRQAAEALDNYRLVGTTLYVTLEPCAMCVGAIVHARVQRLVFAASDLKTGACGGACDLIHAPFHNHRIDVAHGLFADTAASYLQQFFAARRKKT